MSTSDKRSVIIGIASGLVVFGFGIGIQLYASTKESDPNLRDSDSVSQFISDRKFSPTTYQPPVSPQSFN